MRTDRAAVGVVSMPLFLGYATNAAELMQSGKVLAQLDLQIFDLFSATATVLDRDVHGSRGDGLVAEFGFGKMFVCSRILPTERQERGTQCAVCVRRRGAGQNVCPGHFRALARQLTP